MLPILDLDFFRKHNACYDPAEKLGENWTGTVLDILHNTAVPSEDKIWAISRKGAMPEYVQRLCAIAFVENTPIGDGKKVFDLLDDERSINALVVAEKHARGQANDEELDATRAAAWAATRAAAWAATRAAAWDAAWDAARAAAWDATWAATRAAAWDAQVDIAIYVINRELNHEQEQVQNSKSERH